jgi:ZIP family zinc transporter
MAVTAPLLAGGVSKGKAILFAALSGMPTMLGGAAGLLIGSAAHTALAAALACAGGTMLYVVFGEIIPQSAKAAGMRVTLPMVLLGAAIGFTANALFS